MWNLAHRLDPIDGAPPLTRIYRGRGELIDHIFASHRLVNPNNEPFVRIFMAEESPPSMDGDANARKNDPGSDHAAVVATFDVCGRRPAFIPISSGLSDRACSIVSRPLAASPTQ